LTFTRLKRDGTTMTARIYRPTRTAMQSGQARDKWLLEYEPEAAPRIEPLMGWTSSTDMKSQIKLRFDTKEEAVAYAQRNGISYRVEEPKEAVRKVVSYSDNFRTNRAVPWSH
jgi:ETC complex I subunit conserved region